MRISVITTLAAVATALVSFAASANYGQVLFVAGDVTVQRGDQEASLRRGVRVQQGDTIVTGTTGRTHIRMQDRTLISLRPDTSFVIEEYQYEPAAAARPSGAQAAAPAPAASSGSRSFYRLIKGGFRTITGLIGKRDKAAFGVRTPVATIGIRGTTFRAACIDACQKGLVFGVSEGSIVAETDAGSLVLFDNEYGFAESRFSVPRQVNDEPSELGDNVPPPDDDDLDDEGGESGGPSGDEDMNVAVRRTATAGTNNSPTKGAGDGSEGSSSGTTTGNDENVTMETEEPVAETPRAIALGLHGATGHPGVAAVTVGNIPSNLTIVGANNELQATGVIAQSALKEGQLAGVLIGPSAQAPYQVVNAGYAPDLNIGWGRWSGGVLRVAEGDTDFDTAADQAGAHWVAGPLLGGGVAVPSTGTRSFSLVGNTDPTSSSGAIGVLGDARLSADFTNQTVNAGVDLSVGGSVWNASGSGRIGSGLGAGIPANIFSGNFNSVQVDGAGGGTGNFGGFFTNNARGAGMTYRLNNGTEGVAGAAVFSGNQ